MAIQLGSVSRRFIALCVLILTIAATVATPGAEAQPPGWTEQPFGVGFFYSTFGENPDQVLLVGGTAQEFCDADSNDPFDATPGTATSRSLERRDGAIDIRVQSNGQPVYLYEMNAPGAPSWIEQVCADYSADGSALEPVASGIGRLTVRNVVESPERIEIFNAVRARLIAPDGTRFFVRAAADLVIENGVPVGNPEDFVTLRVRSFGQW